MRVALLSYNAQLHNAVGNLTAEKVRFFLERGAEVRLFVEDDRRLHPAVRPCCVVAQRAEASGPVWDYLRQADLILAVYAQHYDLLQYLPRLAGGSARIVLEYLGVTPPHLWPEQHREGLQTSLQKRGLVWCADHALALSRFGRHELLEATHFPTSSVTILPPSVDVDSFHPEPSERFLHERLRLQGRILLYVGRLAGNKRVPLLIEALARLDDSSVHAVIVGDRQDVYAEEAQRCLALAQRLGLAPRVHFAGQLDEADLPRAYRSAAALVMPSLHEGFCVPIIEAMACGVPVVASRSAAVPETVGDAGLTFMPNDVDDLSRQLRRVLQENPADGTRVRRKGRIAIVSFRFGPNIVGGAETSLRVMARALQNAGNLVEVFTTCTKSESRWRNDLSAGTTMLDGLPVHRFPIDPHDAGAHGEIYRGILQADGHVAPETELAYLRHSIHSETLLKVLRARQFDFDAIITGPYLFGLTAEVARTFPAKTLLVPCFHDEPLARLAVWRHIYGEVAGILYHSPEEQQFAQTQLGVNHPNSWEVGTCLSPLTPAADRLRDSCKPYLVYCGRYSAHKNLPLFLEWARLFQVHHPDRFDFVFMGEGDFSLPAEPWVRNLGRVEENVKRSILAGARALVQLSTHESLSLVVLEAWAEATPVVVHRDCPVLAGQIARAHGGVAVADAHEFAAALDDLWHDPDAWRERGKNGQDYVSQHYASSKDFARRLHGAIDQMTRPLADQMRQRGLQHARSFSRPCWQERFGAFVEGIFTQPSRPYAEEVRIQPLRADCRVAAGTNTLLVPIRLTNTGTHAVAAEGPGRTVVCCEIRDDDGSHVAMERHELALPALLTPGQAHVVALPVEVPHEIGSYRLLLWTERKGTSAKLETLDRFHVELPLTIEMRHDDDASSCAAVFLENVQEALSRTHPLRHLPSDYVDVTEGQFAPVKRFLKTKLLNNFKRGYVDVLSRQQSQVNEQLVLMVQQLADCCAMLDHAVSGLHQRLDNLDAKVEKILDTPRSRSECVTVRT